MKEQLLKRTKEFAHACVKVAVTLPNNYLGNHIKGQLIRCSTSVAANYRATCVAQSKRAFISKISIVIEASELTSIFIKSRKTAQQNLKKK
ncbi:MAG: four helix bundle protein [Balneola sp.]